MTARRYRFPIIVVSLPRHTERRNAIRAQLDDLGLSFEFFDAVDAQRVTIPDEKIDHDAIARTGGQPMSPPQLACTLSHRLVYQSIVDRDLPGALVLEDDVKIRPGILDALTYLDKEASRLSRQKDIFHLGIYEGRSPNDFMLGWRTRKRYGDGGTFRKLIHPKDEIWGTFGNYIPVEAGRSILNAEPKIVCGVDAWKYRRSVGTVSANWIAVPPLVAHPPIGTPSELEAGRQRIMAEIGNRPRLRKVDPFWWKTMRPLARHSVYPIWKLLG